MSASEALAELARALDVLDPKQLLTVGDLKAAVEKAEQRAEYSDWETRMGDDL